MPQLAQETLPGLGEIAHEAKQIIVATQGLTVVTHEQYLDAAEHGKRLKIAQKKVKELFSDPKRKAKEAHSAICSAEKSLLDPLLSAEADCDRKIKVFLVEEDRKRREEARRLQEEAAARARQEAEEKRKAEEDERLRTAEMLEAQGFKEEAEQVLSQPQAPINVQPIPIQKLPEAPKAQGVFMRDNWKGECIDLKILVQEVAAGRQPLSLITIDQRVLNDMAKALKSELNIPGCRVYNDATVTKRTGTF